MNRTIRSRLACLAVVLLISFTLSACMDCEQCMEGCTLLCFPLIFVPVGGAMFICIVDCVLQRCPDLCLSGNTTQLTNNDYSDGHPQINNNGYVVWYGSDGSGWQIFLYDGTNTTQLTSNDRNNRYPQINDNGYVVWREGFGIGQEIFLHDGTTTTQITDNARDERDTQINDNGYVTWSGWSGLGFAKK